MADLLVRNIREEAARSLKARAVDDRRSVTAEAAQLLAEFAECVGETSRAAERRQRTIAASKYWQARLAGRDLGEDSTAITRHDRDTDHGRA